MLPYALENAHIVIGDRDVRGAQSMSAALKARGLRDVAICGDADGLRQALAPMVDLVMCDIDLPGLDILSIAQRIRRRTVAGNPFAVLIATARPSSTQDMSRVMKSGMDDFAVKPVAADTMMKWIGGFAESRQPFAVTNQYIGPSRRSRPRDDGSDDNLIKVPNTLRARVVDKIGPEQIKSAIEAAVAMVAAIAPMGATLMTSHLHAVTRLVQHIQAELADETRTPDLRGTVEQLAAAADTVATDYRMSGAAPVAEVAGRLAQLARHIERNSGRVGTIELRLLGQLASGMVTASTAPAGAAQISRQIGALVDSFLRTSSGMRRWRG